MPKTRHALPKTNTGAVELMLTRRVEHLGRDGDIVAVKPGYARNYLLPQGLATLATPHNKRMVEKHRSRLLALEEARLADLKELAERLQRNSITIESNANEEGHLYGSVGATEISSALKKEGFDIAPDRVRLEGPLKELGLYTVAIHLAEELNGEVKVWVVPTTGGEKSASI
jgi:large subunit ribosomal protein L9